MNNDTERDAARYRIARMHITPLHLCKELGLQWSDIPLGQSIEAKVDELLDAAINAARATVREIDAHG